MRTLRDNATRIKRFRELKADLGTKRDRLLVGIDIAKAQHVAQVRHAHTRLLDKRLPIPNTPAGFAAFWAHLERRRQETGVAEIVCALEPTGTYHQALATFLEQHGVDVVLVAPQVAHHNRRTLDGTWSKSDPKDAHNLCDCLHGGHVCFYTLPAEPLTTLRHLVRLLRHARVELGACKSRLRVTLLPALAPAGAPLPPALVAALPPPLTQLLPAAQRRGLPAAAPLPAAFACESTDLAARVTSVQARLAALAADLVRVATPLPAYRLLLSLPGIGPTLAAILLAELGDIAWYSKFSQLRKLAGFDIIWVATGQWTGRARISKCGRPLLRWALYQAALGACRNAGWRARREALIAKRAGDPHAFHKGTVELAAKLLRLLWGVWRSGRPYAPARYAGAPGRPAPAPLRARAGRRGTPPAGTGRGEIGDPSASQAGRVSGRRAGERKNGNDRRSRGQASRSAE